MEKQNKKEITTIPELAKMINSGFQSSQDYMDKRFSEFDGKLDRVEKSLKEEIKGVGKKLDNFIGVYDQEKLPMRVEYIGPVA